MRAKRLRELPHALRRALSARRCSYIHRVGRTGRAGREGQAVTFFTLEDAGFLRSIANVMQQSGCEVPGWMLTMKRAGREQRRKLAKRAPERPDIVQVLHRPLFQPRIAIACMLGPLVFEQQGLAGACKREAASGAQEADSGAKQKAEAGYGVTEIWAAQ